MVPVGPGELVLDLQAQVYHTFVKRVLHRRASGVDLDDLSQGSVSAL
jgi:hypothetical protein